MTSEMYAIEKSETDTGFAVLQIPNKKGVVTYHHGNYERVYIKDIEGKSVLLKCTATFNLPTTAFVDSCDPECSSDYSGIVVVANQALNRASIYSDDDDKPKFLILYEPIINRRLLQERIEPRIGAIFHMWFRIPLKSLAKIQKEYKAVKIVLQP